MQETHFWYVQRRRLLRRMLERVLPEKARVADVGCGAGDMALWLAACGHEVVAVDGLKENVEALRGLAGAEKVRVVEGSAEALPLEDGAVDAVLLLDVLEHVDDAAALREARRVLAAGGWLVVAVPVGEWLWGVRDVDAGHLRRYSTRGLVEKLRGARFGVVALQRYQCFLFPLVVLARVMGRKSRRMRDREDLPGGLVNGLLGAVTAIEVTLGWWVRWPWGSSVVVVARVAEGKR